MIPHEADKTKHNKKGRPSKFEQLEIERRLKPLFTSGISPYTASRVTNYSINTVKKYYNKCYQEIRDSEAPEFVQTCKEKKASTLIALENDLLRMEKMEKELEKASHMDGIQYIQLYKLQISLSRSISDIRLKILNVANSLTFDEMLVALRREDEQK